MNDEDVSLKKKNADDELLINDVSFNFIIKVEKYTVLTCLLIIVIN
jgi:hypothetical protein